MQTDGSELTGRSGIGLSLIIPFFNDEALVRPLYGRLKEVFDGDSRYEFILIDDGSADGTFEKLKALCGEDHRVNAVRLNKGWGEQRAITVGMLRATGKLVAVMQPDLRNNPADVLKLAELITFGTEMASGYRAPVPPLLANKLLALVSGARIRDFGCSIAVYHAGLVTETIRLSPSGLFSKTLAAMLASGIRETSVTCSHLTPGRAYDAIWMRTRNYYFQLFTALELRLVRAGLSAEIIKAGLIWGLTINGLFIVAALIAAPKLSILFIATFLFFTAFTQSVRKNDRRRRDPDPVAGIV